MDKDRKGFWDRAGHGAGTDTRRGSDGQGEMGTEETNAGSRGLESKGLEEKDVGSRELGSRELESKGLEKELQARLDWYMSHAAGEEYDAKAVESILYLLDRVAPLEDGTVPSGEEAWERFQEIMDSREELLPLGLGSGGSGLEAEALETADGDAEKGAAVGRSGNREILEKRKGAERIGKIGKAQRFVTRHKVAAAAVLAFFVLTVGGSLQAGARRGSGFFFWLKEDETGAQRITSPENLDGEMEVNSFIFYDREEVPEWAKEWVQIEAEFEMPKEYEWQCFEVNELKNFQMVFSKYWNKNENRKVTIGVKIYTEKMIYSKDRYPEYDYVQEYEIEEAQAKIYSRVEDSGKIYYAICAYKDNYEYFMEGEKDLEELKHLMEKYFSYIKNKKITNFL